MDSPSLYFPMPIMAATTQPRAVTVSGMRDFPSSVRHHPRYAYRPLPAEARPNSAAPRLPRYRRFPRQAGAARAAGPMPSASLPLVVPQQHPATDSAIRNIPGGMAAMIGMSVVTMFDDPLAGLHALYRRFGLADTRLPKAGAPFSAYPVRFEKYDVLQWKQPLATLPGAIGDTVCALLKMYAPALVGKHMLVGVSLQEALKKHLVPEQLRAAVAAGLMKLGRTSFPQVLDGLDNGEQQAYWLADIILCKYVSALGRTDTPRHLIYGDIPWARRQLAIANYEGKRRDHWAVRDGALLAENPRYIGSTETLEQIALQYCHAQGMLVLTDAAPDRPLVEQALALLREALAPGMTLPAGPDGDATLQPDRIGRIDWQAFDAGAFLLENGAQSPFDGTTSWWVTALQRCFEPIIAPDRSPLDVRGMDVGKLQLFGFSVMRSQGYGDTAPEALSTFFLQTLMDGFFRSVVAPVVAGPFYRALNEVTRPMPFWRCNSGAGSVAPDPGTLRILRSVASVKSSLEKRLFAQDEMACSARVRRWALPVFSSIFLPALARRDLPDQMAYGGIEWTVLDIAASTLGDAHWGYHSGELLKFGWQMDVFSARTGAGTNATAAHADVLPSTIFAIEAALRMAHSAGLIDVNANDTKNTKARVAQIEKALALLQERLAMAAGFSNPLAAARAVVPRRIDTARTLLTEYAIDDPDREFTIAATLGGYLNMAVDTPLSWNKPHPLYKIFMEGGLQQLLTYGDVPDWQRPLLQRCRDELSLDALNRRFGREFDAAIIALTDTVLIPHMQRQILALPADHQRAWQCGKWKVRIPRAQVKIRRPLPMIWRARAFDVQSITHPVWNMLASGAVLVDLQDVDGDPENTHHYWVSLKPFRFQRYDGNVANLLRENLSIFFKMNRPEHHLVALGEYPNLHYYDAAVMEKYDAAQGSVLALVARRLLAPAIAPLREAAYAMTESEQFSKLVSDVLLSMLPFYSCISDLRSPDRIESAGFFCVLDAAGMVPIVGAASKAMSGMVRFAAGLGKLELKALASRFAMRNLLRGEALNSLSSTFSVAASIRKAGKETVYFLDPGIRAASNVAIYTRQLGRASSRALMSRLRSTSGTRRIRIELRKTRRNGRWFFQDRGVWCAQPKKIKWEGGERFLTFDEKRHSVMAIGAYPDVLVTRSGKGVRLVDPRSGLCYGPLIRIEGALLRNSGRSVLPRSAPHWNMDMALPTVAPNCRAKRSPLTPVPVQSNCRLMEARHFGPGFYRFEPDSMGWMVSQSDPPDPLAASDARLRLIDPTSAGYRSYRYEKNVLQESNFFVWGQRLWERRLEGSLHPTIWDVELPDRLPGLTVHAAADGGRASLYVRVDFPVKQIELPAAFRNIQIVPLGSYALENRKRMCMAEIGGMFYTFEMSLLTPKPGVAVSLRKASAREQDIYYTYCNINNTPIHELIPGSMSRLRDCAPKFQFRIDLALKRAREMIADADAFMRAAPASVEHFLRNFLPMGDSAGTALLRTRIAHDIPALMQAVRWLQEHKQEFLGFAKMEKGGVNRVLAVSLRNSMRYDVDPALINKPLIYIDPDEVMLSSVDMLAAYILHETTHTRLGTLDSMHPDALEPVYVRSRAGGYVDIADLMSAAREEGNDPGLHAATLENVLIILAYAYRGERSVANVFSGRSTVYRRKPD